MTLTRSWSNESIKLELVNKTVPELLQLNEFNVFHFNYVLFPGNYSITFRHCDIIDIDNLAFGCEPIQDAITSGEIFLDFWILEILLLTFFVIIRIIRCLFTIS